MPKQPTAKKKQPTSEQTSRDRVVIMLVSLLLGTSLGFGIAQLSKENSTPTTSAPTTSHSHSEVYEVSSEEAPKVELVVSEDKKSGYNIKVIATDFVFAPENVNGENSMGEGHAHLYIDGEKVARLYSPYYHWDGSFEGNKEFKVTLNANDHSEYTVDGIPITATLLVNHDSNSTDHDESHTTEDNHSHQ